MQVTFVTGQLTNNITTVKEYLRADAKQQISNSKFQSCNISTECTQSFPFIDNALEGTLPLSGTNRENSYYASNA